jgi:hypothetical protein
MKTHMMVKSVVAAAALSSGLSLGLAGTAGASTTHTVNCTTAQARVPKIQAREAKATAWVPKAQSRQAAAVSAGHPKVAARIGRRITRVEKLEAKGEKVLARIAADCGGTTSPSTPAS